MSEGKRRMQQAYYAVVFTSQRTPVDREGCEEMSQRMVELAAAPPGYLGIESARGSDGVGITLSCWESLEVIRAWKAQAEHQQAQARGRSDWYTRYRIRICRVGALIFAA
jgi:heme-degrading monooxygenase HmoA